MTSARLNCPTLRGCGVMEKWSLAARYSPTHRRRHCHCINWNCSWSQHKSIWIHKVVQCYLYFKVHNSGEVKPPPMKSISDPRFALPRLPPVLRSSVVPLVPHREQLPQLRPWQYCDLVHTHTRHNRMQYYYVWQLSLLHNLAWSKDGFYLRRDPRAA